MLWLTWGHRHLGEMWDQEDGGASQLGRAKPLGLEPQLP